MKTGNAYFVPVKQGGTATVNIGTVKFKKGTAPHLHTQKENNNMAERGFSLGLCFHQQKHVGFLGVDQRDSMLGSLW